jgi:hypothetical protein
MRLPRPSVPQGLPVGHGHATDTAAEPPVLGLDAPHTAGSCSAIDILKGTEMLHRAIATLLVLAAAALPSTVADAAKGGKTNPGNPAEAVFEQGELDLGESWGDAAACIELGDHTECFRTEAELFQAHPEYGDGGATSFAAASGELTLLATCSSSLRLYRLTGFTGGTLVLTTRAIVHNLSLYGFDNDTSSYRVGACASTFWAGASGSGSVYPGNTGAFASASAMLSGWNNVVSSVYIS